MECTIGNDKAVLVVKWIDNLPLIRTVVGSNPVKGEMIFFFRFFFFHNS